MPHDINGTLLEEGDNVVIEATITSINQGEEYCNVTMETDEVMFPSENKTTIVLNAKQVTLCRKGEK